jgi:DNA-binding NtrC family response regulator
MFESQLFGHTNGDFPGVSRDTLGFIRSADRGTLFLDEIGQLPPPMQARLLRVIQERRVLPVGATIPCPVDVRIITATHHDLDAMAADGLFRPDLLLRLQVITLELPPLRRRPEDVPLLAEHYLNRQAAQFGRPPKHLSPAAKNAIQTYSWPGNIPELFDTLERAQVLAKGDIIELDDLPPEIPSLGIGLEAVGPASIDLNLSNQERQLLLSALERAGYSRSKAAQLLGIEPRRLNRLILAHKIDIRARKRANRNP